MPLEAFYLPAPGGQRFCLLQRPAAAAGERGALVFVHPFAEEMNKSRRLAAIQARTLAAAGYSVLQMDLQGCGDSSGEFQQASWSAWVEDVRLAAAWLRRRSQAPLWLWGLRAGCLVAAEAARQMEEPVNFLFWQPVASGRACLQQFLRIETAAAWLEGEGGGTAQDLRQRLAAGEAVEVAGYRLPAGLAQGLERASLAPAPRPGRLEWLEIAGDPASGLSPAAHKGLEAWRRAGHRAAGRAVAGPRFWQTVEIAECPALVDATLAALAEETKA